MTSEIDVTEGLMGYGKYWSNTMMDSHSIPNTIVIRGQPALIFP